MPKKIKTKNNPLTNLLLIILFAVICLFIFVFINKNKNKSTTSIITNDITSPPITNITWDEALNLLNECQIQSVFERKNLEVFLYDKDNHTFKTTEPKRGDIIYKINHLPSICTETVKTITE